MEEYNLTTYLMDEQSLTLWQKYTLSMKLPKLFDQVQELPIEMHKAYHKPHDEGGGSDLLRLSIQSFSEIAANLLQIYNSGCSDYAVLEKSVVYLENIMCNSRSGEIQRAAATLTFKLFEELLEDGRFIEEQVEM